jgi:predicted phosphodiesterase
VDPQTKVDHFFDPVNDGKRFAVQHFDYLARPFAASGKYAAVFYGHNHKRRYERSDTADVINPGTILGYDGVNKANIPSTFVVYDTEGKELQWFVIVASSVEGGAVKHTVNEYNQVPIETFQL